MFQADVLEQTVGVPDARSAGSVTTGIYLEPRMFIAMERRHLHSVALWVNTLPATYVDI